MNAPRSLLVAASLVALVACGKKDKDEGAHSAEPATSAAPVTTVAPAAPPPPAIEAHVKAELDNRPDGLTGTLVASPGALATMHAPTGWTSTKGEVIQAASADKKAHLAVTTAGADGAPGKLPAMVGALGLTDCQWNPPEPLVLGKTKLAATGADGVCKRGATVVHTAYAAPTAEKLVVVGAWDPDGDSASVFASMRSITKPPQVDPLAACCAALRQNARSAPPQQQQYYLMAAAACDSLRHNPQGRAYIAQIRAQMRGAQLPSSCR